MSRGPLREAMKFQRSPPPPAGDLAATVAWLRDRTLIADLYDRYAYGVDSLDMELVRSVFLPDCEVVGTVQKGKLEEYLGEIEPGLARFHATMHFKGNQYIEIDGDRAFVETWVVGYHMEAPGSATDHLKLGLRYCDALVRCADEWKISHREAKLQWHTGPLPRSASDRPG